MHSKPPSIAIIGSGIGGLALAIGLLKQNVPCIIYEGAPKFDAVGAGIGLGPNSLKAMAMMDETFAKMYDEIKVGNMSPDRLHEQFEVLGAEEGLGTLTGWNGGFIGHPKFTRSSAHRKALLEVMKSLVPEGTVKFNKRVVGIEHGKESGQVYLEFKDGEIIKVDAVIGGDGIKGLSRKAVLGSRFPEEVPAKYSHTYVYRGIAPMDEARKILGEYAENAKWFMKEGRGWAMYPISKGTEANIVVFIQDKNIWQGEQAAREVPREELLSEFHGFDRRLVKLAEMFVKPMKWPLFHHPDTPTYYNGRICMLGDAAHASGPSQAAGAGQGLEDALILSRLLGLVKSADQLDTAFQVYDAIRRPRAQGVVRESYEVGVAYYLVHPDYGHDLQKITDDANKRLPLIWWHDLEGDVKFAEDCFYLLTGTSAKTAKAAEATKAVEEKSLPIDGPEESLNTAKSTAEKTPFTNDLTAAVETESQIPSVEAAKAILVQTPTEELVEVYHDENILNDVPLPQKALDPANKEISTHIVEEIQPQAAPLLSIPVASSLVTIQPLDTTLQIYVKAANFFNPIIPGHEIYNCPTMAFLLTNQTTGRQVLFDAGGRKDFWNFSPVVVERFEKGVNVKGLQVNQGVSEVLTNARVNLSTLESVIWSHWHFDHIGDMSQFPDSVSIVVGPGFKENFLPGYPSNPESTLLETDYVGHEMKEISFTDKLKIGKFHAYDFFDDGSFYLLDVPGHAIGHMCGLARATSTSFVLLGADACHFAGSLRPSPYIPLPKILPPSSGIDAEFPCPCPCELFGDCHPGDTAEVKRTTPYYTASKTAGSAYAYPEIANESVGALKEFDASPDVFVCLAHDPALFEVLPLLNTAYDNNINDWQDREYKQKTRWRFLNELPRKGKPGRPPIVEGLWRDGKRVEAAKALKRNFI